LALAGSPAQSPKSTAAVSPWLDEYLLGVAAECDRESGSNETSIQARRRAAGRAVEHYRKLLGLRPNSFWGHYRAAAGSYALDRFAEAVGHLRRCIKQRERHPVLSGQLAGCLMKLGRYDEAMEECNRAIEAAPDYAELLRSRAWIRVVSGRTEGLAKDLLHFELLSARLPSSLLSRLSMNPPLENGSPDRLTRPTNWTMPKALDVGTSRGDWTAELEAEGKHKGADPDDLDARAVLASLIRDAGELELASAEFEKILVLDPDHILGLWMHALQANDSHQFDRAGRDFDALLGHPGLIEYFRKNPKCIDTFRYAIRDFLRNAKGDEARVIGRRALNLAIAINLQIGRGDLYYELGRAYASAGLDRPRYIEEAAELLFCAFVANREYIKKYKNNNLFNPVRAQIDRALKNEMHRRGHTLPLLFNIP
jgi:tetratricopeptide (TPR) repeat protein